MISKSKKDQYLTSEALEQRLKDYPTIEYFENKLKDYPTIEYFERRLDEKLGNYVTKEDLKNAISESERRTGVVLEEIKDQIKQLGEAMKLGFESLESKILTQNEWLSSHEDRIKTLELKKS